MRPPTLMTLVIPALLLSAACTPPDDDTSEGDLETVRQALESRQAGFVDAMAARDAERVADHFLEDALLHIAGMPPVEGREAIRQFYANMFGFLRASDATPERTRVSEAGDLAYGSGRTTNEFAGPDGPVAYTGKYLLVWRADGDRWMIEAYSISSNHSGDG